jgi:AhpD family alkylhydroperoxidase
MIENTKNALAEFVAFKGKMNAELPDVMKQFDGMFGAALKDGALTRKQKELIVVGIAVAVRCEACALVHVGKAVEAGCTRQEILEACAVAVPMGGGPAMGFIPLVMKILEQKG